jgi:hypothetical protein
VRYVAGEEGQITGGHDLDPGRCFQVRVTCLDGNTYQLEVPPAKAGVVATWLRDLSDGYMSFNLDGEKDFSAKRMPGPFIVKE